VRRLALLGRYWIGHLLQLCLSTPSSAERMRMKEKMVNELAWLGKILRAEADELPGEKY
jgi:hypothetical protein